MMIERHMRPRFKAVRKVPAFARDRSENSSVVEYTRDGFREQSRWFGSVAAAYRWIARGVMRDVAENDGVFCQNTNGGLCAGCKLCDANIERAQAEYRGNPAYDGGPAPRPCKWHDGRWYHERVKRIARLLRHYHLKDVREAAER